MLVASNGAYPLAAPLLATFSGVNPKAACLVLNVVQSAALKAPLLVADAVGKLNVITGVVVPVAIVDVTSVPVVPRVKAATLVTVPVLVVYPLGLLAA